mmetsp:Transcript_12345/g.49543  ORF Transcript_12345/g.49543 Transcript_12345/m.49543 type:complete len:274 (+) Transcript_12345:1199-2020(+)
MGRDVRRFGWSGGCATSSRVAGAEVQLCAASAGAQTRSDADAELEPARGSPRAQRVLGLGQRGPEPSASGRGGLAPLRRAVVVVVVRVFVRVVEVLGTAEARLVVERARETEGRFPRGAQEPALGLRVHDGVFVLVFVDVDGEDGDRRRRGIFRVARRVIIVPRLLGSLVRRGDVVRERLGVDEHVAGVVVFRHRGQEGLGRRGTRGGVVLAALGDAQGRPSRHAGGFGGSRVSGRARLGRPDLGRRRARRRARRRIPAGSRSRGWRGYIGRG